MKALFTVFPALLLLVIAASGHVRGEAQHYSFPDSSSQITEEKRPGVLPRESGLGGRNKDTRGSAEVDVAVNPSSVRVPVSHSERVARNASRNARQEHRAMTEQWARPVETPFRATCGVTEAEERRGHIPAAPPAPRIRRRRETPRQRTAEPPKLLRLTGGDVRGTRRYVEVHLVADTRLYRRLASDVKNVEDFSAGVISYTNAMFEPLEISVVLKRLEIWRSGDKTTITSNHDSTLDNFKPHRLGLLMRGVDSDVTVLLTDMDFEGTTIGYALVSSMCSSTAIAVVQTHNSDVVSVSHTVAHELGHVLGMNHDRAYCTCDDMSCVMYEELNGAMKPAMKWSNCSKMHLASHFVHGEFSCLQDIPPAVSGRLEFCGDGIVDHGEQCDCGPADMCSNPCCDALTCTFRANATCASGPCCDLQTCRPAATSTPCRHRRGECDLPEFCSGWSELCPEDTFVYDGYSCDDGQGHCVSGKCGSHRIRCETLFGPGTVAGPDRCFANNVRGGEGQNCGMYRSSTTYRRCNEDSVKCGSIYCDPVTSMIIPRAGVKLWAKSAQCFTSYAQNISAVPGLELAPDGSTCGVGKMCVNQECTPVPSPPEGCREVGCGDHGVCNSRGRCHCDAGFAPPDCAGPGFGGSVDSGHMSDPTVTSNVDRILFLILLVFVPLLCGICALFCSLNVYWVRHRKQVDHQPYPYEDMIDSYCCCLSTTITKTLVESGILGKPNPSDEELGADPSEIEKLNPPLSQRRKTICKVDVNIETPKPEPNSWGTANDALFTDVVTVTPRSSPDLHRRVRLPSGSPLLHHKSQDNLQRPKYDKSFSSDSGCVSDIEEQRGDKADTNMSMSSLVNLVMKVGRGKRSREGSSEPEARNPKQFVSQKSVPLSRLVLDPYASKSNVRQESESSSNNKRPSFNRSLSSDAATAHSVKLNTPESGFLTPKKSSTSINTVSSSDSESYYVNYSVEDKTKENKVHLAPTVHSKPIPNKPDVKSDPKHTGVVATRKAPSIPPSKYNQNARNSGARISPENSKPSTKKAMLPPHLKKQAETEPQRPNAASKNNNFSNNSIVKPPTTLAAVKLKPVPKESKQLPLGAQTRDTKDVSKINNKTELSSLANNQTSRAGDNPSARNDAPRKPMLPPTGQKSGLAPWNGVKRSDPGSKNQEQSPVSGAKPSVTDSSRFPLNVPKNEGKPLSQNLAASNNDSAGDANEFLTKFRQVKSGTSSNSNAANPVVKTSEANPTRKPMLPPTKRLL